MEEYLIRSHFTIVGQLVDFRGNALSSDFGQCSLPTGWTDEDKVGRWSMTVIMVIRLFCI